MSLDSSQKKTALNFVSLVDRKLLPSPINDPVASMKDRKVECMAQPTKRLTDVELFPLSLYLSEANKTNWNTRVIRTNYGKIHLKPDLDRMDNRLRSMS